MNLSEDKIENLVNKRKWKKLAYTLKDNNLEKEIEEEGI